MVEGEKITDIKECKNLQSAIKQPDIVDELITKELSNNFIVGPFDQPPFDYYRVGPIGVAESKYTKKKRLIVDLSSPHGDSEHFSVNDLIDKDQCSLKYIKIDDAIKCIKTLGKNTWLCKTDISNAFKLLEISRHQWHLFMIKWKGKYYVCTRLVFGSRSSTVIFDTLSKAICWIAKNNYGLNNIFHLLDDFLCLAPASDDGNRTMALLTLIFGRLNIPISPIKTVGPCTNLIYLGVELDSERFEVRLPCDKKDRILQYIHEFLLKERVTKRQVLQLLGHFNFASKVIRPGRSFVSYLIKLSTTVKELHYHVHLNRACKQDLRMWELFLSNWNGVSMFHDDVITTSDDLCLYTDASSTVWFSAYYKQSWFCEKWPDEVQSDSSMSFRELWPIVCATIVWSKQWAQKRLVFHCDNIGTVYILNSGHSKCLKIMSVMRTLT